MEEDLIRERIVEVGRWMRSANLICATDGNISVRLNKTDIFITPSGVPKWKMKKEDIVKIDINGVVLEGKKPSSEYRLHTGIYKERDDISAVIHTHSTYATAFAAARMPIEPVLSEALLSDEIIPVAPYATPSTNEVPASLRDLINKHNTVLLANHGVVTVGKDLEEAYYRAERVEHIAKVMLLAKVLGGAKQLSKEEIERLKKAWNIL